MPTSRSLPLWLALLLPVLPGTGSAQGPYPPASVWRDRDGIPHIESADERGLFHAVGYMQAADQLPWIALNAVGMTGRMAELIGPGPRNDNNVIPDAHLLNDFIVRLLGIRVDQAGFAAHFDAGYRARMSAFVDGIKRRFSEIENPQHPEHREYQALAPWIQTTIRNLQPWDLASYSAWNKLLLAFGNAMVDDPSEEKTELVDPNDRIAKRRDISGTTGSWASNGFCFAATYVQDVHPDRDEDRRYFFSGTVAEPHSPPLVPLLTGWFNAWDMPGNNAFMAHLRLLDAAGRERWSSFGWAQPGSPYFLVSSNPSVATCGSAGAPNLADCELLRVKTDSNGAIEQPSSYYHPWRDTDLDNGGDPGDWAPFVTSYVDVLVQDSVQPVRRRFKTYASDFGIVVNPNAFWIHPDFLALPPRVDGNGVDQWLALWSRRPFVVSRSPQPGWVPVVTAYRTPALTDLFYRFDQGAYAIMQASSVTEVMTNAVENLNFSFSVNFAAADAAGRIGSCLFGAVPKRNLGLALPTISSWDALHIYRKGDRIPVPVLAAADVIWDWDPFGSFLRPVGDPLSNLNGFLSYSLFDPIAWRFVPAVSPPVTRPNLPPHYENPGFLTESNDMPWHAWRRVGRIADPNNARLRQMDDARTLYQIWDAFTEPYEKNKIFVKEFEDRLMGTKPPFTVAEVLDTALLTKVYGYELYPDARYNRLQITVRLLAECADELQSGALNRAIADDVKFFRELWQNLANPAPGSYYADPSSLGMLARPLMLQLTERERSIAVRENGSATLKRSDNPLLAFAWDTITLPGGLRLDGSRADATANPVFSAAEIAQVTSLVAAMRQWNGSLGADRWEPALVHAFLDSIFYSTDCPSSLSRISVTESLTGPVFETCSDPCALDPEGTGAAYSGQPVTSDVGLHRAKLKLFGLGFTIDPAIGRDLASLVRPDATVPDLVRARAPLAAVVDSAGQRITNPTRDQMLDVLTWLHQLRNEGPPSLYPFTAPMLRAVFLRRLLETHAQLVATHGSSYTYGSLATVRVMKPGPVMGTAHQSTTVAYQQAGAPAPGGLAFHAKIPDRFVNGIPVSYLVGGGSNKPIVTLWNQDEVTRQPTGDRFTWFWNFPGQRVWPWSPHYADHADSYRTKGLRRALLDPVLYRDWINRSPEVTTPAEWPLVLR